MIDLHLMHASPEMLQAGYMLPKIPQPIPIIYRLKPKMKEEMREMEEKGAKEEKGTNPENKAPAAKIYIFYFYHINFISFFYYRFFVLFYYYIFYYIDFISYFITDFIVFSYCIFLLSIFISIYYLLFTIDFN